MFDGAIAIGLKGRSFHVERKTMSDLSNLLGDVYGAPSRDEPPARREPAASERPNESDQRAPEWSSQSRLDQAFDGWVPGEAPTGGEQLAEALAVDVPRPQAPAPYQAPAPMPQAPMAAAPAPAPRPAWTAPHSAPAAPLKEMAVVAPAPGRSWLMGDDDIFPSGKKAKRKK